MLVLIHGSTILLLDDYPDSMEAVATWLAMEGWHPICAQSVEDAIAFLACEQLHAVVMEPHLRSGSALSVALAARRLHAGRIKLVAVTASGRAGDPSAYEPTLFDFNLVKPVAMEQLARILIGSARVDH